MNRRVNTIDHSPSSLPNGSSVENYQLQIEANGQSVELPFKPQTPLGVGNITLKEVIQYDTSSRQQEEANEFAETEAGNEMEIDAGIADTLSGLRRESLEGRNGPEYRAGDTHTEQEMVARYQDWVRGTGRMLDIAWDEGAITDSNLQEWMAFKQQIEAFHAMGDPYALSDIGTLRGEVLDYVKRLGVGDKAFAAYIAATD